MTEINVGTHKAAESGDRAHTIRHTLAQGKELGGERGQLEKHKYHANKAQSKTKIHNS